MSASISVTRTVGPDDWQQEQVDRLWSYWGSKPHHLNQYFTHQVGHGVVKFLAATGRLSGHVLDYGCGPGFLIPHLLDEGVRVHAADTDGTAIDRVNHQFRSHPAFDGATRLGPIPSPLPAASFDVVTCIETLEHLPEELLRPVVADVKRVLRPGGVALFTTPHNEDLEKHYTYCPFCDSEFHHVQHVRRLTASFMRELLESQGFDVAFCRHLNFRDFQADTVPPLADLSPRAAVKIASSVKNRLLDRFFPRPFPHQRTFRERLGDGFHLAAVATVKGGA